MALIARVLSPLPLPEAFDYAVPEGLELAVGDHVAAPLGPRLVRGVVTGLRDGEGDNRPLKFVAERLGDTPLPANTLAFIEWASQYACEPPGEALALTLRGLRAPPPTPKRCVALSGRTPSRQTPARTRVIEAAKAGSMSSTALSQAAGVSTGVVKALIDEGVLAVREERPDPAYAPPDPDRPGAALSPSQAAAARRLCDLVQGGGFQAVLLDGVTGSGKTEVYLEAVAAALRADPQAQVLILLPEIALTQAVIARFADRFGAAPAEWHSGVSPPRRRLIWEGVASGRRRIVVGARSALFLPFRHLRLIVVDEEHDGAFKQEDGFIYHARDFAVARARIEAAMVVLASATPSLETVWNAQAGRYHWLRLAARHGDARLPAMELVDLRATPPERGRWLSPPRVRRMAEGLARREQSLLFLNRRGYAPLVLCRACGERMTAPDTDSWLVEHRYSDRLVCHLTGFSMPRPQACPHCQAKDSLSAIGPGVERLQEEASTLFPHARIAVFSSDLVPDAQAARALIARMTAGEIDILVATQSAAKGHNFPHLTLVGVVDADLGLKGGDLRAAERTYQLLAQVSGRAGRAEKPGYAMLQTYMPDHPVMQALKSQDRDAFLAAEAQERALSGLPPYGRLAALIMSSPDPAKLDEVARALAAATPNAAGVQVYGPADAPLALIRGRRRKRFLVRAERRIDLQAYINAWIVRVRPSSTVRLTIDIDPYSFF